MTIGAAIKRIAVARISQDEIGILLACETATEAQRLDFALDGYTVDWNNSTSDFFLKSPRLGSYRFKIGETTASMLNSANVFCAAYPLETGQLESLPPRQLMRVSHPM